MYYRKALELQAFLDMAKDEGTRKLNCKPFCHLLYTINYNYNSNSWLLLRGKKPFIYGNQS